MKKLTKNNRSAEQERREQDAHAESDNLNRRKRPDRRMAGMDVSVVDVSETAFDNFIQQLIYKYK